MSDHVVEFEERVPGGRLQVWRTDGQWAVSWLPDMRTAADEAGRSYTADEAGVDNDPAALLA